MSSVNELVSLRKYVNRSYMLWVFNAYFSLFTFASIILVSLSEGISDGSLFSMVLLMVIFVASVEVGRISLRKLYAVDERIRKLTEDKIKVNA